MSYFTNPFSTPSAVPIFASSPLNPLPSSNSFPLPASLRRTSLVRAGPVSPPPAHHPQGSDFSSPATGSVFGGPSPVGSTSGGGSSNSSTTQGAGGGGAVTGGGITFISPFATSKGPNTPPATASPIMPSPPIRRGSAVVVGPRQGVRAASHSRSPSVDANAPVTHSTPGSRRGSFQATPSPIRSPGVAPALPFFSQFAPSSVPSPTSTFLKQNTVDFSRRRSVDVGVLGLGTHRPTGLGTVSKRVRDAVGPDAGDKQTGFVGTDLKGGKDRLLGRHLASILAHSLALCADPAPSETVQPVDLDDHLAAIPASPNTSPSTSRNTSVSESAFSSAPSLTDTSPMYTSPPTQSSIAPPVPLFPVLSEAKRFKLIGNLQSWTFNAMGYTSDELLSCVGIMFESVRNMEGVQFDLERFKALLLSLRSAYHARNGYHNFSHATDVTQACYSFLVRMGLAPPLYLLCEDDYDPNIGEGRRKWRRNRAVEEGGMGELLRPMDVFALMVAAIGHDVGHPGLSNAYMVNAKTPVAQVYEDKSVLENFHTVTLIHMLRRHNFDYLLGGGYGNLGDQATSFRKVLEASILATDMSRHFDFVRQITELGRRFGDRRRDTSSSTIEDDRLLLCSGLIKCADISNPTRPHRISRAWSTALLEEWTVQANIETEFGLPVSVMTLDPTDTKAQAKSQVGFIDLFAKPLFNAMAGVVDEFADFAEKLRDGRIAWEAISLQTDEAFAKDWKLGAAPGARASSTDSKGDSSSSATATPTPSVPLQITPQPTPRGRSGAFRPNALALHRHSHNRKRSDASSSSTNASPLSPCFPGSISSVTTGASSFSLSSTPLDSHFPSPRGLYNSDPFASLPKSSCGGACTAVSAQCETCSKMDDPNNMRRPSLGRALAGILITGDSSYEEHEPLPPLEDDDAAWPPYAFRPSF